MGNEKSLRVLAVDIGTSWIKSALFGADGRLVSNTFHRAAQPIRHSPDGGAEIDPPAMRRVFLECLESTLAEAGGPVSDLSVSCFWHGLLGVDELGRPVTPVYTWADSRSGEEARLLRRQLAEREIHRRTGCMIHSSFWPAKLRWLRRRDPGAFENAARWMSAAEWLQAGFCGRSVCGPGMASGTGLFNPTTLQWDDQMLDLCGLTEQTLNPLTDEALPVGASGAQRFPLLRGALWRPAIGDGAAGNLGCGAGDGQAALNLGTSAALRIIQRGDPAPTPFGLFCYCVDGKRRLVGSALSNAGNLRSWCRRQLRLPDEDSELEKALAGRRRPRHGLLAFPFWVEERFPDWDEVMPAGVFGFRQSTSALDLLQALTEAVCHRLAEMLERLERFENRQLQVIVSGGAARSQEGLQRLSDVLGRPVTPCLEPEASLRGAAVYALGELGLNPTPPRLGRTVPPDLKIAETHRAQRLRLRDLERRLRRVFEE